MFHEEMLLVLIMAQLVVNPSKHLTRAKYIQGVDEQLDDDGGLQLMRGGAIVSTKDISLLKVTKKETSGVGVSTKTDIFKPALSHPTNFTADDVVGSGRSFRCIEAVATSSPNIPVPPSMKTDMNSALGKFNAANTRNNTRGLFISGESRWKRNLAERANIAFHKRGRHVKVLPVVMLFLRPITIEPSSHFIVLFPLPPPFRQCVAAVNSTSCGMCMVVFLSH